MLREYKNILVAVDSSKNSEVAFNEAMRIAKENNGSLYIACIVNEIEVTYSSFAPSKILQQEKEAVEVELLKKVHDADEFGIAEITPIVEIGDPKHVISTVIPEQHAIDLIVIGATGKGALQRAKVGTTTSYVVEHAPCNVLVVR